MEVYWGFNLFSFCLSVSPFSFFAKPFQKVLYASYHPEITIHSHPKYSLQCKIHVRWCYCCSLRLMSFNFFGFPQNVLFYFFDPFSVSLSLCSSLLGESCWQKLGANLLGKLVSILGQNRPAVALLGQNFCRLLRNSASRFHWLSSSIFNVRLLFVVRPASVTPPLISTIWCFRPYKPYIFCEDMILATCQCHSLLSWAQFTVV